jgi:imidazolonepropionase-like amidohydrolase
VRHARGFLLAAAAAALPLAFGAAAPARAAQEPAGARASSGTVVAYRAALVHRSGAEAIADGCLLVADGKVVAIVLARDLPPLTPVVDLGDAVIFPGLVAADTTLTGNDGQGDLSLGAHRHAFDGYDGREDYSKVLERGITTVYLSPDRNRLIGGRGAVVKTAGERRVLAGSSDLRVDLTPEAWFPPDYFRPPIPPTSENPLLPAQAQAPTSRPGALLALREAHAAATAAPAGLDPNADGLRAFLAERHPLRVVVQSTDEALAALALAQEWQKPLVMLGLSQVDPARLAAESPRGGAILVFQVPLFGATPELGASWTAPAPGVLRELTRFGPVAVCPGPYARWTWLLESAAAAVGFGMSEEQALDAISAVPAQALGVADRVGSLRDGRDADFIVLSGAPLDPAARVRAVYVDGRRAWSADVLEAPARIARGGIAGPEPVVVRAGTVWTGDGPPLTGGAEVLLQDGRVLAVGRSVPHPAGARVVDAGEDAHVTPGFLDARSVLAAGGVSDARVDLGRLAAGSLFSEAWLPVARAGVTTLVIGPAGVPGSGARGHFVKTAAASSADSSLAGRHVVFFDLRSSDRALGAESLSGQLRRGKAYFEKWEKFREERAKWEGEQAAKQSKDRAATEKELRARLARGQSAADGDAKDADAAADPAAASKAAEEEAPKEVDPINGLWTATIENQMLPEPIQVELRLHHEGAKLSGVFSSPDDPSGETMELEGTYDAATKSIRFELPTEMGTAVLSGKVTAPDVMEMRAELQGLGSIEFTASRIEIEEGGPTVARKRVKTDDGPQPPSSDWGLEGMRALFEGRAVAVVYAERRDEIGFALGAFAEHKLPVRIGGGAEALDRLDELLAAHSGVVLGPEVRRRSDDRDEVPAALLLARGVPIAFQSSSGVGARFLPDVVKIAVRHGLGADQALTALTAGAADLLGVADRVGRLKLGLDGDLVVHSGPPLDLRSRVLHVFVNGREVPQE